MDRQLSLSRPSWAVYPHTRPHPQWTVSDEKSGMTVLESVGIRQ